MYKKLLPFILFILLFQFSKAQNEFITVWNPSLPSNPPGHPDSSNHNQIWFPGTGTNYTIYWEEIGYPAHNATLTDITSEYHVLIDFGTPLNPEPSQASYRVKVSNGNGNFHRIGFAAPDSSGGTNLVGDNQKILKVEQWGNISWSTMKNAFVGCSALNVTATDIPDFSNVTDMSQMFLNCSALIGNPTINNWNTSHVTSFIGTFSGCYLFNQPIGNWDTSNANYMGVMFLMAMNFNQPLANWNTSKVVETNAMFQNARAFNQPIGSWDMSSNLDAEFMFANAVKFNQPLGNWNTSKIIEMNHMFLNAKEFDQDLSSWDTGNAEFMDSMFSSAENFNSDISGWNVAKVVRMPNMFSNAKKFNQDIGNWDVKSVKNMSGMFDSATDFNQNLGKWELNSLLFADNMLRNSALSCQNYDATLSGWSQNPLVASGISISSVAPLIYSNAGAVNARNFLMINKNWTITGDTYDGECSPRLGVSDVKINQEAGIYPNPARDVIYIKNSEAKKYTVFDTSGRAVLKGTLVDGQVNIQSLVPGNYMIQFQLKDAIQNLKFIKIK